MRSTSSCVPFDTGCSNTLISLATAAPSRLLGPNGYIEVQYVFANSQLRIQRNGRLITNIRLNKDHIGPSTRSDRLEFIDQRGRNSLPTVRDRHGQIIDIDL